MVDRRQFFTLAAGGAMMFLPGIALATVKSDRRFIFIIQRGAADGLNIVLPHADPHYAALRGALAIDPALATRLDGSFALHPALVRTAEMFGRKEALFVHAVASPYRDRSHFDGQNVLETGGSQPYRQKDGWLNRLASILPAPESDAIALSNSIPMALRGGAPVTSYAPSTLAAPSDDLMLRVGRLYEGDPQLHACWSAALDMQPDTARARNDPEGLGRLAGTLLAREAGPRIAMLETAGWDTHSGQAGRLTARLSALDTLLHALRDSLGPIWQQSTVLVATEFGRTAAANGTGGTDHGTGSVAWILGGGVKGGRVIADWPGLAPSALHQGRDLRPTLGLDQLIAAVAGQAMAVDPDYVAHILFPTSKAARGFDGLIA